ncbi:MAG TPA: hypothetical protein EYP24_05450 [bacterium (Candidatus Stahlbacteria)]|nr:hypothetical protein [Candidatus Stahlbacteria bacterium]
MASIKFLPLLLISCLHYHKLVTPVLIRIEGPEERLGEIFQRFCAERLIEGGFCRITAADSIVPDYTLAYKILVKDPPGAIEEKGRIILSVTLERNEILIFMKNYDGKGNDLITIVRDIGKKAGCDVLKIIQESPRPPSSPRSDSGTGQPRR